MSKSIEIEFTSGEVIKASILAKALNVLIVHTSDGKFLLISKYTLKNPENFKFKE